MRWFLDLRSGDVLPLLEEEHLDDDIEQEEMEENPEVFLQVETLPSRDGFAMMDSFVEELPEGEAKRALARALRMPKPFRSFKDTLLDFPEDREAWFKFQTACLHRAAVAFLEANSVPWTSRHPQHDPPA